MASPLPNEWHLRTVAESSAKACYVCYKPTTRVLITPDNKDFFYVCVGHLSDRGFASPLVDPKVEAEKEREEAKKREIEKVIKEYEEKQHKKKEMKKAKKDGDEKDGGKDKKEEDDDQKAKNERDEKIKSIEDGPAKSGTGDVPRVYVLHRNFYQMRVERLRSIELARRNQQRLKDPTFFPQAPNGDLV